MSEIIEKIEKFYFHEVNNIKDIMIPTIIANIYSQHINLKKNVIKTLSIPLSIGYASHETLHLLLHLFPRIRIGCFSNWKVVNERLSSDLYKICNDVTVLQCKRLTKIHIQKVYTHQIIVQPTYIEDMPQVDVIISFADSENLNKLKIKPCLIIQVNRYLNQKEPIKIF